MRLVKPSRRPWNAWPVVSAVVLIVLIAAPGNADGREEEAKKPVLVAQLGHGGAGSTVAIARDGRFVATGSTDGPVILWEMATGREVRRYKGSGVSVGAVALSPSSRYLAASYGLPAPFVGLWDVGTGKELHVLEGHQKRIYSLCFSPDERFLVTCSMDRTARLWDVQSGREVRRFERGEGHEAGAAFSPDGRFLLTGGGNGLVRLWDVDSGAPIRSFEGETPVAFRGDGRVVLTGHRDGTTRLYEVDTGRELRRFKGHFGGTDREGRIAVTVAADSVGCIWDVETGRVLRYLEEEYVGIGPQAVYSADGRLVLAACSDHTARLWDAATGRVVARLRGHTNDVSTVSWASDDHRVLTGSRDGTARLWDAKTGREIRRFEDPDGWVMAVALSRDGRLLATGTFHETANVWEVETGRRVARLEGHDGMVKSVAFSADGNAILTGSSDATVRLWNWDTGQEVRRFEGHGAGVSAVCFAPDARFVLSASADDSARIWDAGTGAEVRRFGDQTPAMGPFVGSLDLTAACFSPDGRFVVAGSRGGDVFRWDAGTGELVQTLAGPGGSVASVAVSPDGAHVLTCFTRTTVQLREIETSRVVHSAVVRVPGLGVVSPDAEHVLGGSSGAPQARLWATRTGEVVRSFVGRSESVEAVVLSSRGRYAVTGGGDRRGRVWELPTGRQITTLAGHENGLRAAAFLPDGRHVVTWAEDARLWALPTGAEIRRFGEGDHRVTCAAASPDGRLVAAGGFDQMAHVWEVETGSEVRTFSGHRAGLQAIAFTPDGRHVLSTDHQTVRCWNVDSGQEVRAFPTSSGSDSCAAVSHSPDGRFVLTTASHPGEIRVWDATSGDLVRTLPFEEQAVREIHFADGGRLALGVCGDSLGRRASAVCWDLTTGRETAQFPTRVHAVSPDGGVLLSVPWEGQSQVWRVATGEEICLVDGTVEDELPAAFSRDGRWLASPSTDHALRVWDAESGREVCRLTGHDEAIAGVAFLPDGLRVLTGSHDGTLRLWNRETGEEIRRFGMGPTAGVTSVATSSAGDVVLGGSATGTVHLWDAETGDEIRRLAREDQGALDTCALSPDGRYALTSAVDGSSCLWEIATSRAVVRWERRNPRMAQIYGDFMGVVGGVFSRDGRRVARCSTTRTFDGLHCEIEIWSLAPGSEPKRLEAGFRPADVEGLNTLALSSDAGLLLTGSLDGVSRLVETTTGRVLHRFAGSEAWVESLAFSPDGSLVFIGTSDGRGCVCDTQTGREKQRLPPLDRGFRSAVFSPDGTQILTGGDDGTTRLWDAKTGRREATLVGHEAAVTAVAFSPDGRRALTGSADETMRIWDVTTGREVRRLEEHGAAVASVAFSPDGRLAHAASLDGSVRTWNVESGRQVSRHVRPPDPPGPRDAVASAGFSPDDRYVFAAYGDKSGHLWEAESGRLLTSFRVHAASEVSSALSFAPDGRHVTTTDWSGALQWSLEEGKETRRYLRNPLRFRAAAMATDGRFVITSSDDGVVRLWEPVTGRELAQFRADLPTPAAGVAFSPDGALMVLIGEFAEQDTPQLRNVGTGTLVARLRGHEADVTTAAFSPDGRFVYTGAEDSTTRVWDATTGRLLCTLISFRDDTWAVVDPAGRFDASNGGDIEGLHWVVDLETISLDQLKDRYYDPGLFAKYLGLDEEPLRDVAAFDSVKLYPRVDVEPPGPERSTVGIRLTDRGGGLGRVVVLVNGKEVAADARGDAVSPDQPEATLEVDLAHDPRVRPGQQNTVQVFAYNEEGYLRSRGPLIEWKARGKAFTRPPELWAVVCGISDYRTQALDLRYADKDADDFASALGLAAAELFGEGRVHLTLLSTSGAQGAIRPTRANFRRAFEAAKQAGPDDLLVVYLSGHGVNVGGQDGDYHYLLVEAASADLADPAVREATSVSSAELTAWINEIPATKRQVLILDTCAAGKLIEELTEARNVPGSQVRALQRVKDRTGMFVLAGCAADRVSYEATRFGQGLLTYSLLLGMRGGALREDAYVDVQRLFDFAADQVPMLARDIGGVQRPVVAQPRGGASFDIGRLIPEVRDRIPLQAVKPVFVQAHFQDDRRRRDTLRLEAAVEAALRDVASRGGRANVVYVDAREMPDAHQLTGGYVIEGQSVRVTTVLWHGEEEVVTFEVTGDRQDVPALAQQIVAEARSHVHTTTARR